MISCILHGTTGFCEKCFDAGLAQQAARLKEADSQIKDSGSTRQFDSGAHRDNADNKPRFDLLPVTALERVAKHYAAGAKKYGENNWRKGMPRAEFLKSALRHLFYLIRGDDDEDHAAAVVWNVLGYIETCELDLDKARV